jgi:hypothetical protein
VEGDGGGGCEGVGSGWSVTCVSEEARTIVDGFHLAWMHEFEHHTLYHSDRTYRSDSAIHGSTIDGIPKRDFGNWKVLVIRDDRGRSPKNGATVM